MMDDIQVLYTRFTRCACVRLGFSFFGEHGWLVLLSAMETSKAYEFEYTGFSLTEFFVRGFCG